MRAVFLSGIVCPVFSASFAQFAPLGTMSKGIVPLNSGPDYYPDVDNLALMTNTFQLEMLAEVKAESTYTPLVKFNPIYTYTNQKTEL